MKNTAAIFRSLIVASVVSSILSNALPFAFPNLVPPAFSDAFNTFMKQEPNLVVAVAMGILGLVGLIAAVGLLLLKRWSRNLALGVTAIAFAAYPGLGALVYSGWAFMLLGASYVFWGAALAMAYFSDVRSHFES